MTARARTAAITAAVLSGAAWLAPVPASAQSIDPARVGHVALEGEGRGTRVDPRRTGRTPHELPTQPVIAWRRSFGGPLEAAPVVAADGRIAVVVGGSGEVRVLSAKGDDLGAVALGGPAAEVAPAFLADGTLVVLTATAQVAFVGRDLQVRRRVPVSLRAVDALPPTPTPSGTVVLAAGRVLVEIDPEGRIVASATLDDVASGPVTVAPARGGGHEVLVATSRGDLVALRAPFDARRVTALGGPAPGGIVVADDGAAWASVAGSLVRVERRGGALPWRANAGSGIAASHRPPTLALDGSVAFVGVDGSLVVLGPGGDVRHRVALDRVPPPSPGGAPSPSRPIVADEGPPLLVDAAGRIAFARPSGRVGVVSSTGLLAVAAERLCATPIGIAPAGPRAFVVACGEGVLIAMGEATGDDAAEPR